MLPNQPTDTDWTSANVRDAELKLYEIAVAPAHEAFQVSWQSHVAASQGVPRPGAKPKDMSEEYVAYWRAYGMAVIQEVASTHAEVMAKRMCGVYVRPVPPPGVI